MLLQASTSSAFIADNILLSQLITSAVLVVLYAGTEVIWHRSASGRMMGVLTNITGVVQLPLLLALFVLSMNITTPATTPMLFSGKTGAATVESACILSEPASPTTQENDLRQCRVRSPSYKLADYINSSFGYSIINNWTIFLTIQAIFLGLSINLSYTAASRSSLDSDRMGLTKQTH